MRLNSWKNTPSSECTAPFFTMFQPYSVLDQRQMREAAALCRLQHSAGYLNVWFFLMFSITQEQKPRDLNKVLGKEKRPNQNRPQGATGNALKIKASITKTETNIEAPSTGRPEMPLSLGTSTLRPRSAQLYGTPMTASSTTSKHRSWLTDFWLPLLFFPLPSGLQTQDSMTQASFTVDSCLKTHHNDAGKSPTKSNYSTKQN